MIQGLSCIFMSFLSSSRLAVTHPKSQTTAFHSGVLHAFLFTPRCSCSSPLLNTTVVYWLCSLENRQRHSGSLDFFLPPTMLRSLFGWDSSSSKGFLVFLCCCQIQMLEPCSCGLLSRQFCSVFSLPIFLCCGQEFSKTPWQSVPTALLLSKVYFAFFFVSLVSFKFYTNDVIFNLPTILLPQQTLLKSTV